VEPSLPETSRRSATAVDPSTGARLAATLIPWRNRTPADVRGTDIDAEVSGIPAGITLRLVVVDRDGTHQIINEWVNNDTRSCKGSTTTRADEIASIAIEGLYGRTYVSAPVK
jgi:hypothetical protein